MNMIKMSIITVCRNAEDTIRATIESVLQQTYQNIEYIIIDGASTDNTLAFINEYKNKCQIKVISEPDKGIYDAMNKGVRMAEGNYIQFLNAGDSFYDVHVVSKMVEAIQDTTADIVYGNICYYYANHKTAIRTYGQSCSWRLYYLTGDCINHQAIFANRKCFENNLFNLRYQICADREWMIRCLKKRYRFQAVPLVVCNYSLVEESASIKYKEVSDEEAARCIREHFLWGYPIYLLFTFVRNNAILQKFLHFLYNIIYIRKR